MPPRKNTGIRQEEYDTLNPLLLLKGLLASYIVTIPAFLLFALILANLDFPQRLDHASRGGNYSHKRAHGRSGVDQGRPEQGLAQREHCRPGLHGHPLFIQQHRLQEFRARQKRSDNGGDRRAFRCYRRNSEHKYQKRAPNINISTADLFMPG